MTRFLFTPLWRGSIGVGCVALLLSIFGNGLMVDAQPVSPPQENEPNSPGAATPGLFEPGLSQRALPIPGPLPLGPELDVVSFYWQTHPFENGALMVSSPVPGPGEAFRPVTVYAPPLGLRPKVFREGPVEFYPWAGISQSFDSNVQWTQHNPISDFFATPRAGLEMQLGSSDSVYTEGYETILAMHLAYEGYGDLFYLHPNLSAYNQQLDFGARIGRDRFIVRPFLNFSDITGNNLQLVQLQNRAERIITYGGTVGELALSPITSWRQTYSALDFEHGDPTNINYMTWSTRQELTYLLPNDTSRALLWLGANSSQPSAGFSGNEYLAGVGWEGQFGQRLSSELHIGWGQLQLNGNVPGRSNLSGPRYTGHVSFDWTERLRLTLLYDRYYVYNENTTNDNYVTTMTQLKAEIYMGDNWLLIPYFGSSFEDFQLTHRLELDLRPEIELAYIFGKENFQIIGTGDKSRASRLFIKFGYDHTENLRGSPDVLQGVRVSTGFNWNF